MSDVELLITPVAPPRRAAYLRGAAHLPNGLRAKLSGKTRVTPRVNLRAQASLDSLKAEIRFRREQYERQNNCVIIPERPAV